jgi:hypothetical protein
LVIYAALIFASEIALQLQLLDLEAEVEINFSLQRINSEKVLLLSAHSCILLLKRCIDNQFQI